MGDLKSITVVTPDQNTHTFEGNITVYCQPCEDEIMLTVYDDDQEIAVFHSSGLYWKKSDQEVK